ncbi:olfactory receptor 2AG1-like [Sarcophilus harrisii]|uniref:G-protein coupled receptors family 1 profile domain-containing protein n=1 Tax=Sarcophilus harrisii TaxID=9305 RepID=A0A7N4V105_SARHA|nr:olfactory receptor 2AG1-like [Sarcophilus harrisii]
MDYWNTTLENTFFLIGILQDSKFPGLVCATITFLYLVAVISNGFLLLLIAMDKRLHVPMYLLLSQLSLMDLLFTTVISPKTLVDYLCGQSTISFLGCGFQMFVIMTLGGAEDILLSFMAYDRYVAIQHPLNYMVFMRPKVCWSMVATSWLLASLNSLIHTTYTMHFPFCRAREIHHLLCEIPPLLKLTCADTTKYQSMVYTMGVTFLFIPLFAIFASYTLVLTAVFHMPSTQGRQKALFTCLSHLTVVGVYYGAAVFMYILPSSYHNPQQDNILSVFYTVITPTLNPLIYSLRNKDVLGALKKVLGKGIQKPKL